MRAAIATMASGRSKSMSDYIEREDAKDKMAECMINGRTWGYIMDEIPSADVVEVRHGHWTDRENKGIHYLECSNCGCWYLTSHLTRNSYCPNCGAKMDGKGQEHE